MYAVTSINIPCIAFAFAANGFPPSNTFAAKLCLVMSKSLLCDFNTEIVAMNLRNQARARARAFTHGRRARHAACALGRRVIVAPVPDWLLTIPGLYMGSLNSTATD